MRLLHFNDDARLNRLHSLNKLYVLPLADACAVAMSISMLIPIAITICYLLTYILAFAYETLTICFNRGW